MKSFIEFVLEEEGMKGMSVKGGHKRTVKQGAGLTKKGVEKYRRQNPNLSCRPQLRLHLVNLIRIVKPQRDVNLSVPVLADGTAEVSK